MDDVLQVHAEDPVIINTGAIRSSTGRHQYYKFCHMIFDIQFQFSKVSKQHF